MNTSTRELVPFFSIKKPSSDEIVLNSHGTILDSYIDQNQLPQTTTTESPYHPYEPQTNYYIGAFLIAVVSISFVCNFWVILVMCMRKRRFKSTHMFIIALAISDALFSITIHPLLIAVNLGSDVHELFGKAGCDWYAFGAVFFGSFSMCLHASVSFTRYKIIVCSGEQYWNYMKPNVLLLLFSLCSSLFFALAPVLGWGRYETFEYGCTIAFHDDSFNTRSYVVFTMSTMFMIPFVSCCYFYWRIIWFSYDCKMELFLMTECEEDLGDVTTVDPLGQGHDENEKDKKDVMIRNVDPNLLRAITLVDRKLTRLTLVATTGFMLAWLPFAILCFWEMITPPTNIPSTFRLVASLFAKSAAAYNPFIYFFMGREFRDDCEFIFGIVLSRMRFWKSRQRDTLGFYMDPSSGVMGGDKKNPNFNRVASPAIVTNADTENGTVPMKNDKNDLKKNKEPKKKLTPILKNSAERMEMRLVRPEKSMSSDNIMETVLATNEDIEVYNTTFAMRISMSSPRMG